MLLSGIQAGAENMTFGSCSHRVLSAISTALWKSHKPGDITTGKTGRPGNDQYVSITLHLSINIQVCTLYNTHSVLLN